MSVGHPELAEAEHGPVLVEDPHDALLAPDRGDRGHPDVGVFAVDLRASAGRPAAGVARRCSCRP